MHTLIPCGDDTVTEYESELPMVTHAMPPAEANPGRSFQDIDGTTNPL